MGLNVLIVGAGMYVCGKGTNGIGTILPTLAEFDKSSQLESVSIVSTSVTSAKIARGKYDEISNKLRHKINIDFYPKHNETYLDIARRISGRKVAIVSVPDNLHFEITSELIKLGFHCLVVKPLAPTQKEVEELCELSKKYKVYGAVEFHKRFDRANIKLRQALVEEKIGKPLSFIVEYSQRKEIPLEVFKGWAESSNIFQYLGIHYVDIIYFSTKALPCRVMALGRKIFLKNSGVDTFDLIDCVVEWEKDGDKFNSNFHVNWIDPKHTTAMSDQKIKVIGTKGRYESNQKDRGISLVSDEDSFETINPDFCQFYLNNDGSYSPRGYGVESIETFLKDTSDLYDSKISIDVLQEIRPSFEQSRVPTKVIEAANKSLMNNGEWVEL